MSLKVHHFHLEITMASSFPHNERYFYPIFLSSVPIIIFFSEKILLDPMTIIISFFLAVIGVIFFSMPAILQDAMNPFCVFAGFAFLMSGLGLICYSIKNELSEAVQIGIVPLQDFSLHSAHFNSVNFFMCSLSNSI